MFVCKDLSEEVEDLWRDNLLIFAAIIIKEWNDQHQVLHQGHITMLARDLANKIPISFKR